MTQRTEIYSSMDTAFLRELAENINLSFRSHAETDKDALVKLLDKKISPQRTDTVLKMYLTCYDAKYVAKVIKPKGMEEIVHAVKNLFCSSECIYEVTVGSNRCDMVLFLDDEIISVEVKSSQDKLRTVRSQIDSYAMWANRVFLAYDKKHKKSVGQFCLDNNGLGLIEFDNGTVRIVHNAVYEEKDVKVLLSLMTYNYLGKSAQKFNIVPTGRKRDIANSLAEEISKKEAIKIFKEYLRHRAFR
jgi:hypothetical protein